MFLRNPKARAAVRKILRFAEICWEWDKPVPGMLIDWVIPRLLRFSRTLRGPKLQDKPPLLMFNRVQGAILKLSEIASPYLFSREQILFESLPQCGQRFELR